MKRYGVIFTCMASRVIHPETVKSLETDSLIYALRRFPARRGPTRPIRSGQGTNFVSAKKQLKDAAEMDQARITYFLLKNNCDWFEFQMNAPCASHMGGVWERQILGKCVTCSQHCSIKLEINDESLKP